MSKSAKITCIVIASVLSFVILMTSAASAAISALSFIKISELSGGITGDYYGEDVAREDDVKIAGEYVIKSTKSISDAYLSGSSGNLSDKDKETLEMAEAVLDEITADGMTDYEKELAVYDWMTAAITGDEDMLKVIHSNDNDDNPYGALKYHNAVCVGYATTFRLFMQMLEIDCKVVHNSDMFHSWDLVKLGDGWYHVDIYSDAGAGNYGHFNLTDEMMDQSWNTDFFPVADSYEYCYAALNAVAQKDIYRLPAMLREAIDDGEAFLSVKFGTQGEDEQLAVNAMLSQIEEKIMYSEELGEGFINYSTFETDDDFFAFITIYQPDYGDGYDELSDDVCEKIDNAVEKSFGDLTKINYDDVYNETK